MNTNFNINQLKNLSKIFKNKYFLGASAIGFLHYGTRERIDNNIRGQKLAVNPDIQDHHAYTLRNHIWTEEEIAEKYKTRLQHVEGKTTMDKFTYWVLRGVYTFFNAVTFFDKKDPSVSSMKFRLILLESIAGVPPFIKSCEKFVVLITFRFIRKNQIMIPNIQQNN